MLSYPFKNYQEFKELFGMTEHGNGVKSRKNRILLSYLKQPGLLKRVRETGDYSLINIHSMAELRQVMLDHIQQSGKDDVALPYEMYQTNYPMLSPDDFNRIADEYRTFYCCDDVEPFNENHNGSKEDDHEILGFT